MKTTINPFFFLLLMSIFLSGCYKEKDEHPDFPSSAFIAEGVYLGDYWPSDAWRTCRPEEVGMDSEQLKRVNDEILILKRLHVDIHGLVIIKNGYIVAEQYYSGYAADSLHPIYSCTKSITSALYGIALEEGLLSSLDEKVLNYFPEYEIDNPSLEKDNISIEHMLTMSAGFEWMEIEYPYDDERNTFRHWVQSDDRVEFVLDLPLSSSPGEEYNYNTGISHVLSSLLQKISGKRTDKFAEESLFAPLGIKKYHWFIDPNNVAAGGHGVQLVPRDLAKFGLMYLNQGKWDGAQIIPSDWVQLSTSAHIPRKYIQDFHYGYHWWVKEHEYFVAVGAYGQWMYVAPDHDLVVVFVNNINEEDYLQVTTPERLLNTYILPAINY